MPSNSLILEAKVEELGSKCAEYSEVHGEENPSLLMEYGLALFNLAKHNSSLVDNQKMDEKHMPLENPNVKVARMDAESDGEEENVGTVNSTEEIKSKLNSQESVESVDKNTKADSQESTDEVANKSENATKTQGAHEAASEEATRDAVAGEKEGKEQYDQEEVEEEEDENDVDGDDFVAAFNIVDLVRVLLEKKLEPDSKNTTIQVQLAKCRELLGDISLEDDNAPQAIEDYAEAIKLKRSLHGDLSGQVSEAEFMLSIAHDAAGNQDKSLEHLKLAARAAEAAKLSSASELKQRAEDMEADLKHTAKAGDSGAKEVTAESISGRTALASAVQSLVSGANDISQLTRKRKRPDPAPGATKTPEQEKKVDNKK